MTTFTPTEAPTITPEELQKRIKNRQAVMMHVGKLGAGYQDWVHKTRVDTPVRFFEPDWMENLTFCPWWTVPLYWAPIVSWLLWTSPLTNTETMALWVMGILCWPLLEYALHRYFFHMKTETYWANTCHFLFHGNHHLCPQDTMRLVFPPLPATFLAVVIGGTICTLLGDAIALRFVAGLLTGCVMYDMVHFTLHKTNTSWSKYLQQLKIHHMAHHKLIDSEYGITNMYIDTLMGTKKQKQRME